MNEHASYVVAGGFGGIGRAILLWMADRGAKNLIVPSNSGPSSQAAQDVVSQLTKRGVRIITTKCNAASVTELTALLRDCAASMPPVRGCINAAMTLQVYISSLFLHSVGVIALIKFPYFPPFPLPLL